MFSVIKIIITRKRFSEKPIVAFTNSTVFILGLCMTKPVCSYILALSDWNLKQAHIILASY